MGEIRDQHTGAVLAFASDGNQIFSGSADKTIAAWDSRVNSFHILDYQTFPRLTASSENFEATVVGLRVSL